MHVHGAWAQEEILADLPVRAADGHEPDNLEFASGKPAALELDRSVSTRALIDAFSKLCEFHSSAGRERARAEFARRPVCVCQAFDRGLAFAGRGESDARAKLCLGTIEREVQVA
jgi:formate-dependent nitrite reductase cytochrome c552 subunit